MRHGPGSAPVLGSTRNLSAHSDTVYRSGGLKASSSGAVHVNEISSTLFFHVLTVSVFEFVLFFLFVVDFRFCVLPFPRIAFEVRVDTLIHRPLYNYPCICIWEFFANRFG